MRSNVVLVAVVLLTVVLSAGRLQAQHPFLIVTEANFPALRALASQSPWSDMKADAISKQAFNYYPQDSYDKKAKRMDLIVSACALSYILDPDNSSTYLSKLYDTIVNYWPDLRSGLATDFQHCVLPGSAFFNSVLALDVMYNGFTSGEITDMENELQLVAYWYNSNNTSWELNLYACRGIWALYINDGPNIDQNKNAYRSKLMGDLTADGIYNEGPGYGGVRLSQEREAKANFMDVLEFTGEDTYYTDSTVIAFMEWLYGYSSTPFRKFCTFGDTAPNRDYHENGSATHRAWRFSDKAARYAAWVNNGLTPPGRLLHYVLMGDQKLSNPELAPSRIFPDGGAWFIEDVNSDLALGAGLWNCMSDGWHSHKDVSAIHLAAYGEHVLRNSGYVGASQGALGFTWGYIHDFAESSNTVLINDTDHISKVGAGITEGFTSPIFDYASSDSGNALPNGHHQRDFLFIHPYGGANGYWVLFDEVDADNSSHQANVALHANSNSCTIVSANQEYKWKVGPYTYGHQVYISIFLGTAPASTSIKNGLLARMSSESDCFVGEYLYSTYDTDGSGLANIVTVLFPHDRTHPEPTMSRISGTGYTGASIAQGGSVEDVALESGETSPVTYGNVSFQGLASWYRLDSGLMTSYFVRKGNYLDDGSSPSVGFDSSGDISIYMEDTAGKIISPGTFVTFYYPGILGVSLNGSPLSNISSGTDWVQVNIPSGTHEVKLEFEPISSPDIDNDGDVDLEDFAILGSQWRQSPGVPSADIAPPGGDGIVDGLDLGVLTTYWLEGAGPPTPDPMTWQTVPYATGSSSIAMIATAASDPAGVEYFFDETSGNPGGSDSGWQDSSSYEDTGLDPNTTYTYQVKARDKSPNQNETGFSTAESATTEPASTVPTLLFSDTFPVYGDFATGGWTTGGDSPGVNSQCACEGENGANLKKSSWMEKALSTVGYTDIQVKYVRSTSNFDGDTTTGEYLLVEWYDGSSWNELERTQVGSCGYVTWTCGSGANDNASWKVRFITNADANNERGCVDDVEIWGTPIP